jgi:hypothetical protein
MRDNRAMTANNLGVLVVEKSPIDPAVKLPADVQATIARGEGAFKQQSHIRNSGRSDLAPPIITSVVDQSVQDRRDANLDAQQLPLKGGRRQPPMIPRLRAVMIVVDRLKADGMPFGVGPNSKMNKAVRNWLNDRASRSPDPRISRRKQITPTAVRELLKQVKAEGLPIVRGPPHAKQTTQDVARELLRKLRASRTSDED